jgi:DNA modification methylase
MLPSYIANLLADARHLPIADGVVQCVVTSPPYFGLRDYDVEGQIGLESTIDEYVATMRQVFREVFRVLRGDGTLWLNLGDSYSASGKGPPGSFVQSGNRGASIGGRRNETYGLMRKNLLGIPWRVAFALQSDGWYLRSDIIWAKPNPMPESVTDRPTRSHEYIFLMTKSERYYYDSDAISEPAIHAGEYCKNGSKTLSRSQLMGNGRPLSGNALKDGFIIAERRNCRSVWPIPPEYSTESHFAIFPQKLVERCIKAGSSVGDLIFDPFSGSGTVGRVCGRFQRRFVGCDINPDYFEIANRRQSELQVEMFA